MTQQEQYARIDKFHAHLDICSQCEQHPFNLCSTGARLLKEAATMCKEEPSETIRPSSS